MFPLKSHDFGCCCPAYPSLPSSIREEKLRGRVLLLATDSSSTYQISYSVFNDSMSFANLSVPIQTFASVKFTPPPDNGTVTQFPHDGVAGLGSSDRSGLNATTFFHQLCDQGTVKECRFGLAFKGDGTGVQVLGEVDEALFSGSLAKATIKGEWLVQGDVRVGEHLVVKDQKILMDSGTANVVGLVFPSPAQTFEISSLEKHTDALA